MKTCLGVEFGSTRIKAVSIDSSFGVVSTGDHTWASQYENGVWTYSTEAVWNGLKDALSHLEHREDIAAMGISAMMHGPRRRAAQRTVPLQHPPALVNRPSLSGGAER